jgi:hypothetical protein
MADALSGRSVWVGIGKQAAFGTAVAPSKFFEVTDISGILEAYEFKKSDRRVGSRFKAVGYKSGSKVPFSFTVEMNAQNSGLLLMLAMGTDSVAASGAAYRHTITLAEAVPYFTFWASTAQVADSVADATVHQVQNCKVISMKIDATIDDVIKVVIEAVGTIRYPGFVSKTGIAGTGSNGSPNITGITSTAGLVPGLAITGTNIPASTTILSITSLTALVMSANASGAVASFAVATPTPVYPTATSLFSKAETSAALIELGAAIGSLASFVEGNEFHLAVTNGVASDMRIDNTSVAAALREGDSEITGNLKTIYNRNTFVEIKAFQDGTIRAIRFTATSEELAATGQPFAFIFTTDRGRYSDAPASWDPDVISADMAFEVEKTTSYPSIQIVNADASAY